MFYSYLREKGQNYKRNIFPEVRGPVRECEGGWRWRQWWGQTVEVGEEEGSPPGAAERPGVEGRWWWQWPWLDSYQDMWQMMLEIKCQLRKNQPSIDLKISSVTDVPSKNKLWRKDNISWQWNTHQAEQNTDIKCTVLSNLQ